MYLRLKWYYSRSNYATLRPHELNTDSKGSYASVYYNIILRIIACYAGARIRCTEVFPYSSVSAVARFAIWYERVPTFFANDDNPHARIVHTHDRSRPITFYPHGSYVVRLVRSEIKKNYASTLVENITLTSFTVLSACRRHKHYLPTYETSIFSSMFSCIPF